MKKNIFLLSILFLITACSKDDAEIDTGTEQENPVTFTTRGDATDGVSVLIFRKEQAKTTYYYSEEFKPTWVNDEAKKVLELGSYQFLFYRWDNKKNTTMTPELKVGTTIMEDIRFNAKSDTKPNYVLPVDTVWLPINNNTAKEKFTFTGINNKKVSEKLMRAISLVEVRVKRGYLDKDPTSPTYNKYVPLKYNAGKSVLDHFDKITLDIKKVGTSVGIDGNYGAAGTYVSDIPGTIDTAEKDMGFGFFKGPLVFPNEKVDDESDIEITLTPNAKTLGNPYSKKTISTKGKLQRNKKTEITLWLTATYNNIEVIVDVNPIKDEEDGDIGIWE